ncbi:MAG: glutamine-hydrolyzing carbamoyl-phosphate synthase small subunit [Anaerolineae bacterium]
MGTERRGMLALEDGSLHVGRSLAAQGEWVGEVVFVTSMTGYQETITDPSYWGQMVVFTCPHIGNVGVNEEDMEARQPHVRAVLARRIAQRASNWRAQRELVDVLSDAGVPALDGIDTRRLTLTLRKTGVMRGALSTASLEPERLVQLARNAPDMGTLSPVDQVTSSQNHGWCHTVAGAWHNAVGEDLRSDPGCPHVVVIDCGAKENILRLLVGLGARTTVVPAGATAQEILALTPDGVLISNGPGDPEQATITIETVRDLMGRVPLYGICLGHQIICLAAGGRTYKLPFGHHGCNHPVQELASGRISITSQNHNYAVAPDSLAGLPYEVTHLNLFDQTIEGLRHKVLPIASVQYHPESSPGPHDSFALLKGFVNSLTIHGGIDAAAC